VERGARRNAMGRLGGNARYPRLREAGVQLPAASALSGSGACRQVRRCHAALLRPLGVVGMTSDEKRAQGVVRHVIR